MAAAAVYSVATAAVYRFCASDADSFERYGIVIFVITNPKG